MKRLRCHVKVFWNFLASSHPNILCSYGTEVAVLRLVELLLFLILGASVVLKSIGIQLVKVRFFKLRTVKSQSGLNAFDAQLISKSISSGLRVPRPKINVVRPFNLCLST